MKLEKHFERVKKIKNAELRMEYIRILGILMMAERYFDTIKRGCEELLYNIYKDGAKKEEGE